MGTKQVKNPIAEYSASALSDFIEGAIFLTAGGGGPNFYLYGEKLEKRTEKFDMEQLPGYFPKIGEYIFRIIKKSGK